MLFRPTGFFKIGNETMNWLEMKNTEPRLAALETIARDAGRDGKAWWSTWSGEIYEALTKLVGHGSTGCLRSAKDFEVCRKSLLMTWAIPDGSTNTAPWEIPEGETEPMAPAFGQQSAPRQS